MSTHNYRRRGGVSRFDALCIVAGGLVITVLLLPFLLH